MATKEKKDWRDRRDRVYLKNIDSMHVIMPYVMPDKCANEAVVTEEIDLTAITEYIAKRNAAEGIDFKFTFFHVICAALAKVLVLRPKMNYFISGYRMFEHRDIELAFTIKRKFEDSSEESLAKVKIEKEGKPAIDQVYEAVRKYVTKVRKSDVPAGITNQFNLFQILPRPVFRFFVWCLKRLEYHGWYPKFLAKDDPCFCSVYVTNLGSIKMNANYHHLFQWGTNCFFVVISEKKKRPFFKEDGTYEMRDALNISITLDERIADGYYYSKSIKLLKHLLQNPELLELNIETPVDYE